MFVWERRELENYLLNANAIKIALEQKAKGTPAEETVAAWAVADIQTAIQEVAKELFGHVLARRLRERLRPPREGVIPRNRLVDIAQLVTPGEIAKATTTIIEGSLNGLAADDVRRVVEEEHKALTADWTGREEIVAPGDEILTALFARVGLSYSKLADEPRIAAATEPQSIPQEVLTMLHRIRRMAPAN